jgi:ankyrin repeat protein
VAQSADAVGGGLPANPRQASSGAASARASAPQLGEAYMRPAGPAQRAAAFQHAAESGDLATLQTLLAKQVNIDARDSLGRTALMLATLHGQTDTVAALLAAGADPNLADLRGTTPLQAAMAADRTAIIAALQRYGAR